MLLQPDDADAEADAAAVEFVAFGSEPLARYLGGMERGPERQAAFVARLDPVQAAGEVGLNGSTLHVRHGGERDKRPLVAPADQGFAPRREKHGQAVVAPLSHPGDEMLQRPLIHLVLGCGLGMFGERAVRAAIVAAGQRAAVEDREVHRSSYLAMSVRTAAE